MKPNSTATWVGGRSVEPDHPVLSTKYLQNAIEVDAIALADRKAGGDGLMEHIEPACIHSAISAAACRRSSLGAGALATIRQLSSELAPPSRLTA